MKVHVRFRQHLDITYQDLKMSVNEKNADSEASLRKYFDRYFELNYRRKKVVAFYFARLPSKLK